MSHYSEVRCHLTYSLLTAGMGLMTEYMLLLEQFKFFPLTQLHGNIPTYLSTPELRVHVSEEQKEEIVETLHKHSFFEEKKGCSFVDGARYEDEDGWFLIRTSNTEAKVSVRIESTTKEGFARLKIHCSNILEDYKIILPKDISL